MSFSAGIPVLLGSIERELGCLWETGGKGKTRASLINLAVYSEEEGSLGRNAAIIQGLAGEHAMRTLLIEAKPEAEQSEALAWISMNCYVRGARGGEVCSEQISFRLSGSAARSLQSIVFSHLDSDLPLVLWWQADFRPPVDNKLWRWVDRLLFDSSRWSSPGEQFELISRIGECAESRSVLCDLNWARTLPLRRAIAGIFDFPGTLAELYSLRRVEFAHAPGYHGTALLVAGWLAERLGWHLTLGGKTPQFQDAHGGVVTLLLGEAQGHSISRILLASESAEFELCRHPTSDLYVTTAKGSTIPTSKRMLPAMREETRDVLLAELARSGRHPLYQGAVKAVQSLWE